MLARRLRSTSAPRLSLKLGVSRYATKPLNVTSEQVAKPEKTRVEADKIVKEYLDSIKPEPAAPSRDVPAKPIEKAVSKPDSPSSSSVAETSTAAAPLSENLSSDAKKAGQSLSMWKDTTLGLLRSRGAEAAVQLNALGGKLNKVTGYDEIEALKRKVVEREGAISSLRAAARQAKDEYANAVSTRASRQRQVNDLLQRKSTWSDNDVIAFTKLVREDHASAAAELQAKTNLEQAEAAVDAEFGRLMRAILDRYHEEQVWSDKIRSVSTYGSLAALAVNVVVFVLAIVLVEPWKRKRLAQTFERRITEMSEETRQLVEGGMKGLEEHFEKQEGVLAALAAVGKQPILVEREEQELPSIEPVPAEKIPQLTQAELVQRAKVVLDSLTPSTDRDYALMAIGGLGGLITSGAILLFRSSTR